MDERKLLKRLARGGAPMLPYQIRQLMRLIERCDLRIEDRS
jgi:hypothetical protein